ncbi:MAG: AEC family transporter [Bryobacteraceae bacterium]
MRELELFELIFRVIAPVLVGRLVVQAKVLAATDAKALSSAYLYVFLPALLIKHLSTQSLAALFDLRFILATATLLLGIYVTVLIIHIHALHRPVDYSALAAFAASKFNAVIIGLPLLLIAIGRQAIVPVIVNLVLGYFTILPLTLVLLELAKARRAAHAANLRVALARALRHTAFDPLIIASLLGLLVAALGTELPEWLNQTVSMLGSAAVPVPLVAVGMAICRSGFSENTGEIFWMSAARVLAAPILAIEVARLFLLSPRLRDCSCDLLQLANCEDGVRPG